VAAFSVLRHEEGVRLDPTCLVELYARLGEERAEHMMGMLMEDLATRLAEVDRFVLDGHEAALIRCAERLSLVARDIGMTTLARVARDVVIATREGDRTAQAATAARLCRTGDRSFAAIWDIRDVSV
jgi:HPt (histidine-containing phosphotransfer) domain-containing protein